MRVVDKRKFTYSKFIGRGSAFGNPFTHLPLGSTKAYVQVPTVEDAVSCFEDWARGSAAWDYIIPKFNREALLRAIATLEESDILGCYGCQPCCHGDVIIKLWKELKEV